MNRIQLSDKIENATILFADISGFTEYSSKVTPEKVFSYGSNNLGHGYAQKTFR